MSNIVKILIIMLILVGGVTSYFLYKLYNPKPEGVSFSSDAARKVSTYLQEDRFNEINRTGIQRHPGDENLLIFSGYFQRFGKNFIVINTGKNDYVLAKDNDLKVAVINESLKGEDQLKNITAQEIKDLREGELISAVVSITNDNSLKVESLQKNIGL